MNTMRKNLLYRLFSPKESDQKIDLCGGCHWKAVGRFQKCTSCRRNTNLKDHYKPMVVNDDAPDVL
jgi:hypothetical protein